MFITYLYFYKEENKFMNKKNIDTKNDIYLRYYLRDLMFIADYFIVLLTKQKSFIHVLR